MVELETKNPMDLTGVAENFAEYKLTDHCVNAPVATSFGVMVFVSQGEMDLHGGRPYFTVRRANDWSDHSFIVERDLMRRIDFYSSIANFTKDFC